MDSFIKRKPKTIEMVDEDHCDSQTSTSTDSCLPQSPQSSASSQQSYGDNNKLLSPHSIHSDDGEKSQTSIKPDSQCLDTWLDSRTVESDKQVATNISTCNSLEIIGGNRLNIETLSGMSPAKLKHCKEAGSPLTKRHEMIINTTLECSKNEPAADPVAEILQHGPKLGVTVVEVVSKARSKFLFLEGTFLLFPNFR